MLKNNFFFRDELGEEVARVFFYFLKNLNQNKIFDSTKYDDITLQNQIKEMRKTLSSTLYINFEHVIQFSDELADVIEEQYHRIENYLSESVYEFIYENKFFEIVFDNNFPKKFWIGFYNLPKIKTIDKFNSDCFNKLDCVSGIVTKISEPYPEILFGTFECQNKNCKLKINFFEQQMIYSEPKICPRCYNLTTWSLVFDESIFIFLQKIKIQELDATNFHFSIPKTLNILLREDNVGIVKLGDKALFTGSLMTLSNKVGQFDTKKKNKIFNFSTGSDSDNIFSFLGDFRFEIFFLASYVFLPDFRFYRGFFRSTDFQRKFYPQNFSRNEKEKILKLRIKKRVLNKLISALNLDFENFENIKIGIILLLIGGVKKKTLEKIHLRGNIHICLIGNSFYFKNKFLKHLTKLFPKSCFINGNTSTGEGITGSISKNINNDKLSIEAGSLILSDKGICCITDFEKMNTLDQATIFDVMEQQTFSLLKAGVNTSLNIRSSVLATIHISEEKNDSFQKRERIILSIFSRFDLFFSINDNPDNAKDVELSRNILYFNQGIEEKSYQKNQTAHFQLYVSFARCLNPILKHKSGMLLIRIYKYLRKCKVLFELKNKFLSIRHLEGLIRLSESFSKVYLGIFVKVFHVKAAARLFFNCIYSFDFTSKKHFFGDLFRNSFMEMKNKKKLNHGNRSILIRKKRNNISFQECNLISKNILFEIRNLEEKGSKGVTLKFIIKRMLKTQYFKHSFRNTVLKIQKIIMVIRFMVFSNRSLLIIKAFSKVKKKILRLIFLTKKNYESV